MNFYIRQQIIHNITWHYLYNATLDDVIEKCMELTGECSLHRVREIERYLTRKYGTEPSYTYSVNGMFINVGK